VGTSGTILRYDGQAWTAEESGTAIALSGVWKSSDGAVWAVGQDGTMLRRR
jgi:hypothetical protein